MSLKRNLKIDKVKEISDKIASSNSIVIFEYHGLNVKALKDLRISLKENNVEAKVYKNRLFKLALENSIYEKFRNFLTGPNMFLFGNEDEVVLAKKIVDFAKKHPELQIKAGTYEGNVIDGTIVAEIASLPTHEEALRKLMMVLLTPLRNISLIMNAIKEKQQINV